MCGGRGTRLEVDCEKPLYPIAGVPMVDRVRQALAASAIDRIYAVVSPNAPDTRAHLADELALIETPGDGYVADLGTALSDQRVTKPVMTVAADLPLLAPTTVDRVRERYTSRATTGSLTVCVPVALKRRLGSSVDTTLADDPHLSPTGVNIVGGASAMRLRETSYDRRLAVNVNRLDDARLAEDQCV